jgi:nicotinic acid mononucleotide adenylyltransferase
MCELAVEHTSTWLMVDPWEAGQPEYQRTAVVLDHFDEMLNGKDGQGGVEMSDGTRRKYKVMLLAGGDLIESFGEPGVWSEPDVSRRLFQIDLGIEIDKWAGPSSRLASYYSRSIRMSDR